MEWALGAQAPLDVFSTWLLSEYCTQLDFPPHRDWGITEIVKYEQFM